MLFSVVKRVVVVLSSVLIAVAAGDTQEPDVIWEAYHGNEQVTSLSFSPDGAWLATASFDEQVRVVRLDNPAQVIVLAGHTAPVNAVVFTDNHTLVSGGSDNEIRVWDLPSATCTKVFDEHTDIISSLAVSPDGSLLLSGSHDGTVRVWSLAQQQLLHNRLHGDSVTTVTFAPDGLTFASGGYTSEIRIWNLANSQSRSIPVKENNGVNSITYSPDGSRIAAALTGDLSFPVEDDYEVQVYSVANGDLLLAITGHEAEVFHVQYTLDGAAILSCSVDDTLGVWRSGPGAPFAHYTDAYLIRTLAVSRQGNRMALGFDDGRVMLAYLPLYFHSVKQEGPDLVLRWNGGRGLYQIEARNSLNEAWQPLGEPRQETEFRYPVQSPVRFFQVVEP